MLADCRTGKIDLKYIRIGSRVARRYRFLRLILFVGCLGFCAKVRMSYPSVAVALLTVNIGYQTRMTISNLRRQLFLRNRLICKRFNFSASL